MKRVETGSTTTLDGNHPLAGLDVTFVFKVEQVEYLA